MTRNAAPLRLRDATESDFPRILQLNLEWEHFLSPLDESRLRYLHQQAAYHRVACVDDDSGEYIAAFLLGLREGAEYDSDNYQWFAARYPAFAYVDRIAATATQQRRGAAAALYKDIFQFAATAAAPLVACEYNIQPLNEKSRLFHNRFGFKEVGQQYADGKKVSLQVAAVPLVRGGGD